MTEAKIADLLPRVRRVQQAEITECEIYRRLARRARSAKNREILERIAGDEKRHYDFWREQTGEAREPKRLQVLAYTLMGRFLGLTFALKLMERGEDFAQKEYERLKAVDGVERILQEEEAHEKELLDLLHDEPLQYAGSIVLGLNDALVELTGALAGFTLALADGRVVAVAGLVTGIAASLSMAASEYLSSKSETDRPASKNPFKSALYTGGAYVGVVIFLILPFFLLSPVFLALGVTLALAVGIIAAFTFYLSVAKDLAFKPRFLEMAAISLGVAAVSFGIGWLARGLLGVEV